MREGHMTVCSTTLWVGHLSKLVQEDDLSDNFGTYGEVTSTHDIFVLFYMESLNLMKCPLDCVH